MDYSVKIVWKEKEKKTLIVFSVKIKDKREDRSEEREKIRLSL